MAEVFPESWLRPGALEMVLELLAFLPCDAKVKRRTLHEWAKAAGVELTAEMVERVTGLPAGEV